MSTFKSSASHFILLLSLHQLFSFTTEAASLPTNHSCTNESLFQPNSTFEANLNLLLSNLTSNADLHVHFYRATEARGTPDAVNGLFFCRSDASTAVCRDCVAAATKEIRRLCPNQTESTIWYDVCLLRYSKEQSFDDGVPFAGPNRTLGSAEQGLLDQVLTRLNNLVATPNLQTEKFLQDDLTMTSSQKMSCSVQCGGMLSYSECVACLQNAMVFLPTCCAGYKGALVMLQKCSVQFGLTSNSTTVPPPPPLPLPLPPSGNENNGRSRKIVVVVVPIVVSVMLFCLVYYFLRKKIRKSYRAILVENFGIESTALESLQFSLTTIEAATNKFSNKNKIGKGGFGEVYKGNLSDGREIAIKRLSRSSGQGEVEFKNEVLLIAKLQHRNLVTLLGFCLQEREKILIYEYVPNKSLDYFLFGTQKRIEFDWLERYKVIEGIAQGILYLHKYSRLKIIHRDLKPSNVLLDNNMNPKISDFGMAKIVGIDETQGSTNRVVGTFGYMSPEYILRGQFSEKSDIYSFGVMVLEILSGKKNASSFESQYVNGLLNYAWKQWRDKNALEILDSDMTEVGSYDKVIKCIQIGLLCVQENPDARPPMITVVSYLNNDSIKLPSPKEPAFFMHGQMELTDVEATTSSSSQHTNNFNSYSVNEISISKFLPR